MYKWKEKKTNIVMLGKAVNWVSNNVYFVKTHEILHDDLIPVSKLDQTYPKKQCIFTHEEIELLEVDEEELFLLSI